jgi:hypothetical protein
MFGPLCRSHYRRAVRRHRTRPSAIPLNINDMVLLAGSGVWSQVAVSNNAIGGAAFLYDTSLSGSQNRIVSVVQ